MRDIYVLGGSLTGISPGIVLQGTPGPKTLPLVFDNFTTAILMSRSMVPTFSFMTRLPV